MNKNDIKLLIKHWFSVTFYSKTNEKVSKSLISVSIIEASPTTLLINPKPVKIANL